MKRLSNLMLFSNLFCTLFYAMSYPYIYAELMTAVSKNYISFENIVSCIGVVVFGAIWNKYGDILFKHYLKFVVIEIIADVILFADVIIRNDLKFYFILNVLIYSIITKNLSCGGIKMRARVNPTEELREKFDNNSNTINAIATLTGTAIAIVTPTNLTSLFVLALIGNISDNFMYLYIYNHISKHPQEAV